MSIKENISLLLKKAPEEKLEIGVLALTTQNSNSKYYLLNIMDIDSERNLGDYQNITYILLKENARPVIIDPGILFGERIKNILGIENKNCDVIFSHYHLDHWIGYPPYRQGRLFASQITMDVLTGRIGVEKTGRSIFHDGSLTDHHRTPTPIRAVNEAERLLPIKEKFYKVSLEEPYINSDYELEFFELPFGQTEGTLYGVLSAVEQKILFASDLFVIIRGELMIEPHYAFKSKRRVIDDIIIVLKALLGMPQILSDEFSAYSENLAKLANPTTLALGHGYVDFASNQHRIEHLLKELEEYRRIEKEHII